MAKRRPMRLMIAALLLLAPPASAKVGEPMPPQFFLSSFGATRAQLEGVARRYAAVGWHNHPALRAAIPVLKRHNPELKAFMYRELFCVLRRETPLEESVGHYDWIDANHPEWFQHDTFGRRVEVPGYPGRWMMDVGNAEWQAFWVSVTLRDVIEGGWDGVFADDALTTITAHHLPPLAGYPDDASLQAAMHAFLARAHAAFQQAGKFLVANVSNSYDYPGLWERWLHVTDGLMEEHFAGEAWTWGPDVAVRQLAAMRSAAESGKWMLCLTYGSWEDRERMESSLAAYLIGAGPHTYWSYRPADQTETVDWPSAWSVQTGRPLGPATVDEALWQRQFEHALVLVNLGTGSRRVQTPCGWMALGPRQGRIVQAGCAAFGASS